jgi:LPPG:FO 2-phospho-L-lactate transferase
MTVVKALAGPDWFSLGDLDLGVHLTRQHLLQAGRSLTAVTKQLCQQFGIETAVLPMSNDPAPTLIESEEQTYAFQNWFVQERWQPPVKQIILPDNAKISYEVGLALEKADIVVLAPSNPFVSIDPILNVYPIRNMIMDLPQVVLAVSPIIGQEAVKGPAAKMMREMGMTVSATAVANYYGDLIDLFVYDERDDEKLGREGITAVGLDTLMLDSDGRERVAQAVLNAALQFIKQSSA